MLTGVIVAQDEFAELAFRDKLEVVGNEQVRINLMNNIYGDHGPKRELVLEWLLSKEEARTLETSADLDAREEEILSIKRSASIKVRTYQVIAMAAFITAVIAAQEEIMWLISSATSWFFK